MAPSLEIFHCQKEPGQFPSYYKNKPEVERDLGLNSLERGYDSIQIRIWYGYARTDSGQLVIIKKDLNGWRADFYYFKYYYNYAKKQMDSIGKRLDNSKIPKSGWKVFSVSLFGHNITTLADASRIKGYPDFADGNGVIIEVATMRHYRIYNYMVPHLAKGVQQAEEIETILKLIRDQFDFQQLRNI